MDTITVQTPHGYISDVESYVKEGENYAEAYFANPKYTQLMQLIFAFATGIIFAPYSYGFVYLVVFIIVYEFIYATFTRLCPPYWTPIFRLGIIATYLFGWIVGRVVVGWKNPFKADPNEY